MELESGTSTNDVAADSAFERVFERLYGKMAFEEKLRLIWLGRHAVFYYWRLLVAAISQRSGHRDDLWGRVHPEGQDAFGVGGLGTRFCIQKLLICSRSTNYFILWAASMRACSR